MEVALKTLIPSHLSDATHRNTIHSELLAWARVAPHSNVIAADWVDVGGPLTAVEGLIFTATGNDDLTLYGEVKILHPYNASRMSVYNGRLIAVNLFNDLDDGDPSNDIASPIEMAFSFVDTASFSENPVD